MANMCNTTKIIDIVIYHANCPDGFGSALCAWLYFKKSKNIEYYPAHYNSLPPNVLNKNVLICDFSYKKDITLQLIENAKSLLIIDHHISAQKELQDIPEQYKIFDMKHSGAYLTWTYFFPDIEAPKLIKYIEDNDIWKKELPNTQEITAYISSLPFEFTEYEKLLDDNIIENIVIPCGKVLLRQNNKIIESSLKNSSVKFIDIKGRSYFVAICNSNVLQSEIGNQLLTKYKNVNFSIVYSINDTLTYFSLRSSDDRTDVSKIANIYNGGGHRNASGLSLFDKNIFGNIIGDNITYDLLNKINFELNYYYTKTKKCNYVMVNSTHNCIKLCKYLLNTRTIENMKIIQECCSCYRTKYNNPNFYEQFDFAFVWNYGNNEIQFIMTWKEDIINIEQIIKEIFDTYDNFKLNETYAQFTVLDKKLDFF